MREWLTHTIFLSVKLIIQVREPLSQPAHSLLTQDTNTLLYLRTSNHQHSYSPLRPSSASTTACPLKSEPRRTFVRTSLFSRCSDLVTEHRCRHSTHSTRRYRSESFPMRSSSLQSSPLIFVLELGTEIQCAGVHDTYVAALVGIYYPVQLVTFHDSSQVVLPSRVVLHILTHPRRLFLRSDNATARGASLRDMCEAVRMEETRVDSVSKVIDLTYLSQSAPLVG